MKPTNPPTTGQLSIDELSQQSESERLGLTRTANPNELIEKFLHVFVPRFANEGEVPFDAHRGKVFLDITGCLQEREADGDVKRIWGHGGGFAEYEQP